MSGVELPPLGVLADDFTGALDAGAEFVRAGLATTLALQPSGELPGDVLVVNTDSREIAVEQARRAVLFAAEQLRGRRIFKKIDSTLRGHVAVEIEATLQATGAARAVVCPAVVEAGREVRDGCLWVAGVPLHHSDFKADPRWPARSSRLSELLGRPSTHLGRDAVTAGAEELARRIASAATPLVTVDAVHERDLAIIGAAIARGNSLPCGALGLARSWVRSLGAVRGTSPVLPVGGRGPLLILAGSRHPRTRSQVAAFLAGGAAAAFEIAPAAYGAAREAQLVHDAAARLIDARSVVISPPQAVVEHHAEQRRLVATLGSLAAQICERVPPVALVTLGGETASAVCHALNATGVELLGELEVGVPVGRLHGGVADGRLLVTKAGGFGGDDLLLEAERRLCRAA